MIQYVTGDLLASEEVVIAHGCNTQGVMGAGIAKAISSRYYRTVFIPYYDACLTETFVPGTAQRCTTVEGRTVFNLGTQVHPGRNARAWYVLLAMGNMFSQCAVAGIRTVAIPRIGCGIGGLQWRDVEKVILTCLEQQPSAPSVAVYTLPGEFMEESK